MSKNAGNIWMYRDTYIHIPVVTRFGFERLRRSDGSADGSVFTIYSLEIPARKHDLDFLLL